uniref:Uncharacterized protein n=1 Tax=Acrobeloides nanus TaxID=290746 RepID=A0A914CGX8_9BILA
MSILVYQINQAVRRSYGWPKGLRGTVRLTIDCTVQLRNLPITAYLRHLMQHDDPKAAFILPHYTINFYAPNENLLDQIKTNPAAYLAVDFLQGHADFKVL